MSGIMRYRQLKKAIQKEIKGETHTSQNIYDNEMFFKEYMRLRGEKGYNDLLEQPAINKLLLPDIKGKTILDIGCGYGHNSLIFAQNGAKKVIGIDLSQKMLKVAKKESCHSCIEYRHMDMSELSTLTQKFDIVYSSLAFHYVENFQKLIKDVYALLNEGGYLIYSQETSHCNCHNGLQGTS
jgi:2-polyprenyl-3-methyl-5-hydroxy-6-metoxy-1,4-benzoquinol methylase